MRNATGQYDKTHYASLVNEPARVLLRASSSAVLKY